MRNRSDFRDILDVSWRGYERDPHWVSPPRSEVRKVLDRAIRHWNGSLLPMSKGLERLGGRVYKTYRVYQKPLSPYP